MDKCLIVSKKSGKPKFNVTFRTCATSTRTDNSLPHRGPLKTQFYSSFQRPHTHTPPGNPTIAVTTYHLVEEQMKTASNVDVDSVRSSTGTMTEVTWFYPRRPCMMYGMGQKPPCDSFRIRKDQCPVPTCPFTSSVLTRMIAHQKTHNPTFRHFRCHICLARFKSNTSLLSHIRSHGQRSQV